jgi:catechol 2,3-dioxygenase-like lactoylglutathione lyase family enzyme
MKLQFDCVFYYVRDLEAAIRFYSDLLGVPPTSTDAVARFHLDNVLIELVPTSDEPTRSGDGNARLCLKVDDLERGLEYLRGKGIPVGSIHVVENGKLAAFEDPDGNELVLWQYS